ncbi:MAG: addiction module protein [Thermomicrobiales bacterium]
MSMTLAEIEAEVMKLSLEERELLAEAIYASLNDLTEIDEEWRVEIARRTEEIDSGAVQLIPAEQVFAELRAERRVRVGGTEESTIAEAQRRYAELRSGAVQGESLEEVISYLRAPS